MFSFYPSPVPRKRQAPRPTRDAAVAQSRLLTPLHAACRRLLSAHGESNSVGVAQEVLALYGALNAEQRVQFFQFLDADFGPDPQGVLEAAQAYAQTPHATQLIALTHAVEAPRQELLRRLNRAPGSTAVIVGMRRALLEAMRVHPALVAVDADFLHLLSSWFNPGFLQLEQVDWRSSAELLEKIIQHEAVHEIDGWDDLRRRLQPDRRCFAFFHPQLPGEPLIFVEVALEPEMPQAVGPLLQVRSEPQADARHYKVATFYSISNCQPGLKGVSLGNFLIKRVAEALHRELPQLRSFCTLSPIPGFAQWLAQRADAALAAHADLRPRMLARVAAALARTRRLELNGFNPEQAPPEDRDALTTLVAFYLAHESATTRGDPVARFHLGNGARLERLNWAGDLSRKGLKQSFGLMVNYLYDLHHIEDHHQRFVEGDVVAARSVLRHL